MEIFASQKRLIKLLFTVGLTGRVLADHFYVLDSQLILIVEREGIFLCGHDKGTLDQTRSSLTWEGRYYF